MVKTALTSVAIVLLILTLSSACRHELDGPLLAEQNTCDTTHVSFQKQVMPLIIQNCSQCHSAAVHTHDILLDNYEHVRIFAREGSLYGSIIQNGDYAPMPYSAPMLDSCSIAIIGSWIKAGTLNN